MTDFKREHRYWVFKRKHLEAEQDAHFRDEAQWFAEAAPEACPTCVVVEDDWPEYEVVWEMIQARVEGRPGPIADRDTTIAELEEKAKWHDADRGSLLEELSDTKAKLEAAENVSKIYLDALIHIRDNNPWTSNISYPANVARRAISDSQTGP